MHYVTIDDTQVVSLPTMLSIVDFTLELIRENYVEYIKSMRDGKHIKYLLVRRKVLFEDKDYNKYLTIVLQMTNDVFNLMQDGY